MERHGSRFVSGSIDTRTAPVRRAPHWSEIAAYGFALGAATVVLTAVLLEALGGQPITPGPAPHVIVTSPPGVACPEIAVAPPAPATDHEVTVRVVVDPTDAAHTEVASDELADVHRTSKPMPEETAEETYGTVRAGTVPGSRPAIVIVDGKRLGSTPIVSHRVTPGRHTVEFQWPNCPNERRTVDVSADEAVTVRAGNACTDG